jgi:hypothetical protein
MKMSVWISVFLFIAYFESKAIHTFPVWLATKFFGNFWSSFLIRTWNEMCERVKPFIIREMKLDDRNKNSDVLWDEPQILLPKTFSPIT